MYLSRLTLNPRSRRVQSEASDPYQMHRSLMRAFPDGIKEMEERVLFRLEANPRSDGLALLVQSHLEPDWSWLAEPGARGYLLPLPEPNPWVKHFELHLRPGQRLAFRLRANPTIKREGKRRALVREEDQMAWLRRKGEQGGFRVLAARVARQGYVEGWVESTPQRRRYQMAAVQFDGILEVTDAQQLSDCVAKGIGSGKGFGFGLLSLARLQ
jgi:CRISPR system Cascade subunit CasE